MAAYDSLAVANELIKRACAAANPPTHMKLQKLIFFAHGWHLALTGKPLIDEQIQAWKYGPVVSSVYREFRKFGGDKISSEGTTLDIGDGNTFFWKTPCIPSDDTFTHKLLDKIWEVFGCFKATKLSDMTHMKNTPWEITVRPYSGDIPSNLTIDNEDIKDYFKSLAEHSKGE